MPEVNLEAELRAKRDAGQKLLAPYVSGGVRADWLDIVAACVDAGADAVEIGVPFSDPVMDGPTVQEASSVALARGTTPQTILADLRGFDCPAPLLVMTYYNLVFRAGPARYAADLAAAGVSGIILPDCPLEELGPWFEAAAGPGIQTVGLVGPITPDDRLQRVCDASRGFVYGVNLMGVTGERARVGEASAILAARIRAATDLPAIMGFGISTPEQAQTVAECSDGVIVGSALMRRVLDGATPGEVAKFVGELRRAID